MAEHVLDEALNPVLRDLRSTTHIDFTPAPPISPMLPDELRATLLRDGQFEIEVYTRTYMSLPHQIAQLADQTQDWVVEILWSEELPATWPECPQHPVSHPLRSTVRGDRPVWECPKTHLMICDIGDLA